MGYKFFTPATDPLMVGVDEGVMRMLDSAHEASSAQVQGMRYVITSGKRSPGGNSVLKGAVPDSAHLSGLAVDLLVTDDLMYFGLLFGLMRAGFRRYGFYYVTDSDPNNLIPRHIHVDTDPSKPTPCCWSKREQN